MSKLVVIDWGLPEVLVLGGNLRGKRLVVEHLESVAPADGGEAEGASASERLRQVLGPLVGSGTRVLGLAGRAQVVMREMLLPAAEPEELPEMVRFQAMRELSSPVERVALDFDVLGEPDESGRRRVIMAALQRTVIEQCRSAVRALGLELGRLGLRPYATWAAYRRCAADSDGSALVITLADDVAELVIGHGQQVRFSRVTRLLGAEPPAGNGLEQGQSISVLEPPQKADLLAAEVRRTLLALGGRAAGPQLQRVALAAGPDQAPELAELLAERLALPVERFDPLAAVTIAGPLRSSAPALLAAAGRWAAAVGAALQAEADWPIDFLSPKRPVVRPDRRKPLAVAAASLLACLAAAGYFWMHQQLAMGRSRIERLTVQQKSMDETLKVARQTMDEHQAVKQWIDSGINGLQQLKRLSESVPDTRQLHATSLSIVSGRTAEDGRIEFEGVARDRRAISRFQARLRAQPIGPVQASSRSRDYPYSFKSKIALRRPAKKQPSAPAKATPVANKQAKP